MDIDDDGAMMAAAATMDPEDISSLSEAQDKALSLIPIFSGLLSVWGSANIIYMVVTSDKQTSYRRILFGLSCCDLLSSLVLPLQPFLVPADTSQRVWAIGNEPSCSAMGFFQQLSLSNAWYNGMLSFYFLLTVKFGVREQDLARRYEPWMHGLSIAFPLLTASIGAILGIYNEVNVGHGCWITNYPKGCGNGVHCWSPLIAWIFAGIPLLVLFLAILVNNLLVYFHVRYTIQKSRAYSHTFSQSSSMRSSSGSIHASWSSKRSLGTLFGRGCQSNSSTSMPRQDPQVQRIRAVATQAFLYVAAFYVVVLPGFILRTLESLSLDAQDEAQVFPLLLLQSIFWPLQGLFNCIIYVRPSYIKIRQDFPNESWFWAFQRALHGAKVQPTDELQKPEIQPPPQQPKVGESELPEPTDQSPQIESSNGPPPQASPPGAQFVDEHEESANKE